MPGIVVFRRRWSVGSDDLVVPGVFLFTMHLIWTIVLSTLLGVIPFDLKQQCTLYLFEIVLGYLVTLGLSMVIEICICTVAMRGSILDTTPRTSMQYLLYIRLVILLIEATLLVLGILWLVYFYNTCEIEVAKEILLGLIVCNWCVLFLVLITVWCTYDVAGRSWVKMKQFQRSMRDSESRFQYRRSGNANRNWRQRKVIRAYQDSWDQRCRFLFCCMRPSDRNRNSFTDIARLLSDFFRDLDVVPSDVVAGLVLLRKFQKIEQKAIVEQRKNDTYEFLSGVAVTPRTQFLALHEAADLELFQTVIHYMHYALGAYGWPVFLMTYSTTGLCQLSSRIRCCCVPCCSAKDSTEVVEDNCCRCNYAALQNVLTYGDIEIIYVTYHVDVGETPFYVAIDYDRKKIVVSIRGTLSMKDVLTDLNAEGDQLPLNPPKEDWTGHKGMIQAAVYIHEKLKRDNLLEKAFDHCPERGTKEFGLVLVGHSLGAGTASILAILMKQEYPDLLCYSYSPPGGLLSMPAVEYSKSFITSVVVGKDVIPRIGLHQMEALRADLINAIKRSVDPKWKIITCSVFCCGCGPEPTSASKLSETDGNILEYMAAKDNARETGVHPSDSTIALTLHNPLYPPGRIIHVVRHHPKRGEQAISSHEPVYQALWAQNTDFDEVLISPVMIQDHMPDKVLAALHKVITTFGPKKPHRNPSLPVPSPDLLDSENCQLLQAPTSPKNSKLCLETSFTSLQSPSIEIHISSMNSSITNGYSSTKSQNSPVQLTSIITILDEKLKGSKGVERKNLSLNLARPERSKKIDLIYDDWFGLAPLASPESLSEVSSISSRTSFGVTHEKTNLTEVVSCSSEMRTPKILRRTLKVPGNLSTCADDIKNVRYFQKLGQNTKVRCPSVNGSSSTSSGDLSYESATSISIERCCSNVDSRCCDIQEEILEVSVDTDSFQSAENVLDDEGRIGQNNNVVGVKRTVYMETHFDEEIFRTPENCVPKIDKPILRSPGCLDIRTGMQVLTRTYSQSSSPQILSPSTPQILSPSTPQEVDPDLLSNLAIDLNLEEENRSMQFHNPVILRDDSSVKTTSVDSGSVCRTPSECKNVTFNPQVVNIDPKIVSRTSSVSSGSGSPTRTDRWKWRRGDRWNLLPRKMNNKTSAKCKNSEKILYSPKIKKRNDDIEPCFSKNESLPLLTNLSGINCDKTSPNFVRRKKYVYPITTIGKGESSV